MKSLVSLTCSVLQDASAQCATVDTHDQTTIVRRWRREGDSFLTVTMPTFTKAFEKALDRGAIASVAFPGFRKRGGFPLFLGGLLRLVFTEDGKALLDSPSIDAIQAIRQITSLHSKIFEVCDDRRVAKSIDGYVQCEEELNEYWIPAQTLTDLGNTATRFFGRQLGDLDRRCANDDLDPRHGPGATADRIMGNSKFDFAEWPQRLDREFPAAHYIIPGYGWWKELQGVEFLAPADERPVRVIAVPKTAAKARIIATEPTAMQYAQQAVLRAFVSEFSGSSQLVNLTDQGRNRMLARAGSLDGSLATLDLSEASDRVLCEVVEGVFRDYPNLLAKLLASRSTRAQLPDGTIIDGLAKFASMGSATCFPVESIVFATAALLGVQRAVNATSRPPMSISKAVRSISVFGDDIIVPTCFVQDVIKVLVSIGARPNPDKSFWTGRFRESCGGDYYAGEDVGIFRVRQRLPRSRRDAKEVLSLISLRNQAYMAGYWGTAGRIDEWLAELRVPMPIVESTSSVHGRWSCAFRHEVHRYDRDVQAPLVKGLIASSPRTLSPASGQGALLKCTLTGRNEPFADAEHLTYSGRPDRVRTKIGWAQPF